MREIGGDVYTAEIVDGLLTQPGACPADRDGQVSDAVRDRAIFRSENSLTVN